MANSGNLKLDFITPANRAYFEKDTRIRNILRNENLTLNPAYIITQSYDIDTLTTFSHLILPPSTTYGPPGEVFVKSTDAADVNLVCYIYGVDSTGKINIGVVTTDATDGTTPVSGGNWNQVWTMICYGFPLVGSLLLTNAVPTTFITITTTFTYPSIDLGNYIQNYDYYLLDGAANLEEVPAATDAVLFTLYNSISKQDDCLLNLYSPNHKMEFNSYLANNEFPALKARYIANMINCKCYLKFLVIERLN